jgi:hypothetical protein
VGFRELSAGGRGSGRDIVSTVIASQRVGAKAPPDGRLREAIQTEIVSKKAGLLRRLRSSQ